MAAELVAHSAAAAAGPGAAKAAAVAAKQMVASARHLKLIGLFFLLLFVNGDSGAGCDGSIDDADSSSFPRVPQSVVGC